MTRLGLEVAFELAQTNGGRAPTKDEFIPLYVEKGGGLREWKYFSWDSRVSSSNLVDGNRIILVCRHVPSTFKPYYCYVGLANGEVHAVYLRDAVIGSNCAHSIAKFGDVLMHH